MEEKAQEMGLQVKQLQIFFKSMRTRFVKIRKEHQKSGAGRSEQTARDQFIFDTLNFLDKHFTESKTRKSTKFPNAAAGAPPTSDQPQPSTSQSRPQPQLPSLGEDEDVVLVKKEKSEGGSEKEGVSMLTPTPKSTKASSKVEKTQALALRLVDQATKLSQVREGLTKPKPKTAKENEVEHLVGFLQTQMVKIPDENWWDFAMEAMALVRRYQQQLVQQQPQVQQQGFLQGQQQPLQQPFQQDFFLPQQH